MLLNTPSDSARSDRARRTPASIAAVAALGVLVATGVAAMAPAPAAHAMVALSTSPAPAAAAAVAANSEPEAISVMADEARSALAAARAARADAVMVTADISASGLDVGPASTTVDTTELRGAIDGLSDLEVLPVLLLPDLTAEAEAQTRTVSVRVLALRGRLDVALEKKAAAEAAAKAKREAEAAAAATAKAAAEANTVGGAKATAQRLASANYGWGADQFSCLESLWTKESGWDYSAYNAGSGATGIPQALPGSKMASAGTDWQTNATTQITWGLQYIAAAYGSPCSAWGHSQATDWY